MPLHQHQAVSPRVLRWIVLLTCLGLAIAVGILLLPSRSQTVAFYCLTTLGFVFASIRSGMATVLIYQARRRYLAATLALLTLLFLLSVGASLNDLRLFLRSVP